MLLLLVLIIIQQQQSYHMHSTYRLLFVWSPMLRIDTPKEIICKISFTPEPRAMPSLDESQDSKLPAPTLAQPKLEPRYPSRPRLGLLQALLW